MDEYVYHRINGLLFEIRNGILSEQMQGLINNPSWEEN